MSEEYAYKTEEEYQKAELTGFLEALRDWGWAGVEYTLGGTNVFDDEHTTILYELLGDSVSEDGEVDETLVTGAIHVIEHCLNNLTGLSGLTVGDESISTILTN